jgi:hypothetical protein
LQREERRSLAPAQERSTRANENEKEEGTI